MVAPWNIKSIEFGPTIPDVFQPPISTLKDIAL